MGSRAAVYCRISRDKEGAGLGVERQEADCRELADRLGWTVAETFTDNDLSAYRSKARPAYRRMLDAIRAGRVDAVVCWHTDRLHRSPAELEDYIGVCQPREVPTHTVKAGPLDLSSPSGRMVARQLGAVARYEVEHSSERIRRQKDRARANGEWIGGARAFGYERDGVTVREAEAVWVRDGYRRVLAGETIHSITRDWAARVSTVKGGRWTATNVRRVLLNPRYGGMLTYDGTIVGEANWPALVSRETWEAVRAVLTNPARATYTGSRSLKWLGSGLYRCGRCGGTMRPATNRGCPAYRCRDGLGDVTIRAEPLDLYVEEIVAGVLRKHGAGLLPARDDRTGELRTSANALRARLGELEDMFGDGEITRAGYVRQRDKIGGRLDAVTDQLTAADAGSVLSGVADADDPAAAYAAQPIERRRAIVDTLMTVTINPARPGRLPKGVDLDYDRVIIDPRNPT